MFLCKGCNRTLELESHTPWACVVARGQTVRECFQTCVPEIKHLRIQQTLKTPSSTVVLHIIEIQ